MPDLCFAFCLTLGKQHVTPLTAVLKNPVCSFDAPDTLLLSVAEFVTHVGAFGNQSCAVPHDLCATCLMHITSQDHIYLFFLQIATKKLVLSHHQENLTLSQ